MKSEPLKSTFSIRSILEQQDPEPELAESVSENELIENEDIIDNEIDEQGEDVNENLVTSSDSDCPGSNLRTCVDACIPLPLLWVYSVCVRECARRCP